MRDLDVRRALKRKFAEVHRDDGTVIFDEFPVCNDECRVDIALVNGQISGYEIKSERDSLSRLPKQRDVYGRVFDQITIVCATRHIAQATQMLPNWWGVVEAISTDRRVSLRAIRGATANPKRDSIALASLLRRSEAIALLDRYDLGTSKLRRGSQRFMWTELASSIPIEVLAQQVRDSLKRRR